MADRLNGTWIQRIAETLESSNTGSGVEQAINVVKSTYGDDVSVVDKGKNLLKFGKSDQVQTTRTTLMELPSGVYNESYVATNIIDSISSSSASDTEDIRVEGHTISGGNLTFVVQTATLNGQGRVTLSTPLARCTRLSNSGGVDLVGDIYVYENSAVSGGVPTDGTKVHCMITAGNNNSLKASTSISSQDYWFITKVYCDYLTKTNGAVDVRLEVRNNGGVFKQVLTFSCSNGYRGEHSFEPYYVIPKNSDIRLTAVADANGRDVSGGIEGILSVIV